MYFGFYVIVFVVRIVVVVDVVCEGLCCGLCCVFGIVVVFMFSSTRRADRSRRGLSCSRVCKSFNINVMYIFRCLLLLCKVDEWVI